MSKQTRSRKHLKEDLLSIIENREAKQEATQELLHQTALAHQNDNIKIKARDVEHPRYIPQEENSPSLKQKAASIEDEVLEEVEEVLEGYNVFDTFEQIFALQKQCAVLMFTMWRELLLPKNLQ